MSLLMCPAVKIFPNGSWKGSLLLGLINPLYSGSLGGAARSEGTPAQSKRVPSIGRLGLSLLGELFQQKPIVAWPLSRLGCSVGRCLPSPFGRVLLKLSQQRAEQLKWFLPVCAEAFHFILSGIGVFSRSLDPARSRALGGDVAGAILHLHGGFGGRLLQTLAVFFTSRCVRMHITTAECSEARHAGRLAPTPMLLRIWGIYGDFDTLPLRSPVLGSFFFFFFNVKDCGS